MSGFRVNGYLIPDKEGEYEIEVPQGTAILDITLPKIDHPDALNKVSITVFEWPEAKEKLGQVDKIKIVALRAGTEVPVDRQYRFINKICFLMEDDLYYFQTT
jgi:hypothetical protein